MSTEACRRPNEGYVPKGIVKAGRPPRRRAAAARSIRTVGVLKGKDKEYRRVRVALTVAA